MTATFGRVVLPFGKCAVCIAQETPHGWWWLGGTVLAGSLALALVILWLERRRMR